MRAALGASHRCQNYALKLKVGFVEKYLERLGYNGQIVVEGSNRGSQI